MTVEFAGGDPRVRAVLEAGGPEVAGVMAAAEQRMAELAGRHGPVLARHAGGTLAAGGKRLRPLLVCLAAGMPAGSREAVLRAAVAVELVHAATLVHDDVLDRSDRRRGRETVVAAAGRQVATATGDLLFSRAFAELAADGSAEGIRILSRACSELAAGELMQRADAYDAGVTVERYLERCRLKTAVLFRASCELGALAGSGAAAALGEFGERIGVAFQILDDVLDISGPPERTGKPQGTDLLDGTITLPVILASARDPGLAVLAPEGVRTPVQAAAVCEQIIATGALQECRARALRLVAEAKTLLESVEDRRRASLELVADGVVERYS